MLLLRLEFVFEEKKRIYESVLGLLFFLARGLSAGLQRDGHGQKKYNDRTFKLGIQMN